MRTVPQVLREKRAAILAPRLQHRVRTRVLTGESRVRLRGNAGRNLVPASIPLRVELIPEVSARRRRALPTRAAPGPPSLGATLLTTADKLRRAGVGPRAAGANRRPAAPGLRAVGSKLRQAGVGPRAARANRRRGAPAPKAAGSLQAVARNPGAAGAGRRPAAPGPRAASSRPRRAGVHPKAVLGLQPGGPMPRAPVGLQLGGPMPSAASDHRRVEVHPRAAADLRPSVPGPRTGDRSPPRIGAGLGAVVTSPRRVVRGARAPAVRRVGSSPVAENAPDASLAKWLR